MVDKSYNVTLGGKNINNIYYDLDKSFLNQIEITRLVGSGRANDNFGESVSLNNFGNVMAIGAPREDLQVGGPLILNAGRTYILTGSKNSWGRAAVLTANDFANGDRFGHAVSLNGIGNVLAVGANLDNIGTSTDAGSVYIFTGSVNNWSQVIQLTGSDGFATDEFGYSVSLNDEGSILAVGAPRKDPNGATNAGMVYIFTGSGNVWSEAIKITGNDSAPGDQFGSSVSLNASGNILAIGAFLDNTGSSLDVGSTYIFTGNGNSWVQSAKILASDGIAEDYFGYSVSLNNIGDVLAVGTPRKDSNNILNAGMVYIFTNKNNNWIESAKITGNDLENGDRFGTSVSLNGAGDVVAVGSHLDNVNSIVDAGSVYIFKNNNSSWTQTLKITGSNSLPADNFGYSTALNNFGDILAVGAYNKDLAQIDVGAVYVFTLSPCYYLNGIEASGLYFEKGKTYQFIQTGIINSVNPLNIYLDEYKNNKLQKYITISGTAGIDRYLTISIPKSFKQANTLYYGNESGDFFGAPIKLISTDYYLKHNIKLLCFNAYHNNEKYIINTKMLNQNLIKYSGELNYFAIDSGVFGVLSYNPSIDNYIEVDTLKVSGNNNFIFESFMAKNTIRKDILSIDLNPENKGLIKESFDINYFGNKLTYKKVNPNSNLNQWSNLSDLYWLITDKSFADSGSIDQFNPNDYENKEYRQYGYQLQNCQGCIDKIILTTGQNNIYSGTFEIFYNSIESVNNSSRNLFLNIPSGDLIMNNFISFNTNNNFINYSKEYFINSGYEIKRKL